MNFIDTYCSFIFFFKFCIHCITYFPCIDMYPTSLSGPLFLGVCGLSLISFHLQWIEWLFKIKGNEVCLRISTICFLDTHQLTSCFWCNRNATLFSPVETIWTKQNVCKLKMTLKGDELVSWVSSSLASLLNFPGTEEIAK